MVTFYPKITLATNCQHESFKNEVDHFQESRNNKQTYHYNITSLFKRTQRVEVILVQVVILGCKDLLASNYCALVLHTTRISYCQFYSYCQTRILVHNSTLVAQQLAILNKQVETTILIWWSLGFSTSPQIMRESKLASTPLRTLEITFMH